MAESDQSDKEMQVERPRLDVSNESVDTNESAQKRPREENSDDEKTHLPSKKLCTSVDKTTSEEDEIEGALKENGTAEGTKMVPKDVNDSSNKEDTKDTSLSEESADENVKATDDAKSDTEDKDASTNDDGVVKNEPKTENSMEKGQKNSTSTESLTKADAEDSESKEIKMEEEDELEEDKEDIVEPKKKRKSRVEDSQVVEGLELSVECASDKESSSSSDNQDDTDKKSKPKTIIVKEKPNDSELDVSSSEAEKSESQDASELKTPKQSTKKGKKRGRTSFSKATSTDSEDNVDNVSDEDYSPRTKKRLKKNSAAKKTGKTPSESKRGRGRGRKPAPKSVEKEQKEVEKEETASVDDDKKTEENVSEADSSKTNSENDSDSENNAKDGKRGRRSTKPEDDKRIQVLKKYIRAAGIHVKSYSDVWAGCKSNAARVRCLKELLEKNGISGRPTLEKCKKAKERNERLKDIAELNTGNIISEGRVTRAQRSKEPSKETVKTAETPTKHREARNSIKRVLRVVDSDSENE